MQKMLNFFSQQGVQQFLFGVAIYSIFVPFGSILAFIAVLAISLLKEYLEINNLKSVNKVNILIAAAGCLFLSAWYQTIEFAMYHVGRHTIF